MDHTSRSIGPFLTNCLIDGTSISAASLQVKTLKMKNLNVTTLIVTIKMQNDRNINPWY